MKTIVLLLFLIFCACDSHNQLRGKYDGHDDDNNWDWRDHHPISSVDNELITNCSSSYVFAALGAIEGLETINHNNVKKISSQEYIDCSGTNSCKLGSIPDVLNFYSNSHACSSSSYEYTGSKNECRNNECNNKIDIDKLSYDKFKGEGVIKASLIAPIPTKIYIDSLKDYTGGIYRDYDACNHEPNHWVLVVGFGTEGSSKFWIIKNDFGEEWGENGYMRLERGKGMCGIGSESYTVYYTKWKTWLIVIAVVAVLLIMMCCICCCCCCCAVATGSTAKMSHCLCCCCYSGKESCIHPERVDVTPSHHQNNNNIYRADIVNAQPVQPVEGQRVPYNPPVEPQFYPVQQPPIPQQQPIPQPQYYYIPPPVEQQQQQQYIQQPNQTNNNNPPVVQYDEYDKVNYDNQQFERQESKKSEHILLPATSNK